MINDIVQRKESLYGCNVASTKKLRALDKANISKTDPT